MLSVSRVWVEISTKDNISTKEVLKNSQIYKVKWKVGSKWWSSLLKQFPKMLCYTHVQSHLPYASLNFKKVSLSLNFKFLPWQRRYSEFMECKAPAEKGDNVCVKERLKCSLCQIRNQPYVRQ